nr:ribonuclease P protein component [Saprospiraceae bacterium]
MNSTDKISIQPLKSSKAIAQIIASGASFLKYPILIKWQTELKSNSGEADFLFTPLVSAKKIKTAVARNLIKRRIREAVRLNPPPVLQAGEFKIYTLQAVYIYLAKEEMEYKTIEKSVKKIHSQISH